ncbi:hypothetical protein HMPREF9184_01327 [Streptococcus sp. oral taxon 058 str. F0407]|nr:hypothetical protein HMPREF9184_01327 [Streptococcus sp. oral taxon 058 str. F0407]
MEKIFTTCLNSKWEPLYAILITFIACSAIKKYDTIEIGSIKLSKAA